MSPRSVVLLLLAVLIPGFATRAQDQPDVQVGLPIARGFVIADGRYVDPPYQVVRQGEQVLVNGIPLPGDASDLLSFGYGGGWRGEYRDDGGSASGSDQSDEPSRTDRRSSASRPEWDRAALLERRLLDNALVVILQPDFVTIAPEPGIEAVLAAFEKDMPVPQRLSLLNDAVPRPVHSAYWARLASLYQPSAALHANLQELRQQQAQLREQRTMRPDRSPSKLVSIAPALGLVATVVAIGVLVRAGGHALRTPDAYRVWGHIDETGGRSRIVLQLLAVLLVLNVIDLVFTIAAHSTGMFHEVNPISRRLLDDPLALTVFKAVFAGMGIVVLMILRRRRIAEVAAWWMCLVYTVVLLRWITVNSLLIL